MIAGAARTDGASAPVNDRATPRSAVPAAGDVAAFRSKLADRSLSGTERHQRAIDKEARSSLPVQPRCAGRDPSGRTNGPRDENRAVDAGTTAATPPATATPAGPVPIETPAVALGPEPAALAGIEHMATAIAAALARGDHPVFAVTFNGASPFAEAALVTREPGGAVSIRLEGVAPAAILPPAALEAELRVALDRRRVRLGRLEYGAPAHGGDTLNISTTASKRFAEGRPARNHA